MDYGGGSFLTQAQWKKIQNPGVIINWFDDAEDAMLVANQVINQIEEPDLTVQNKITIRFDKNSKAYTFTPKLGTLITKLAANKIKLTTTNPEDKQWEGEYAIYFLENNHDTFVGFYNLTMSGLRLSNFIAHKTLLILCCNGKENDQQKAS